MKPIYAAWMFFALAVLLSCKTAQPPRPMERYDEIKISEEVSLIRIPVRIFKEELERDLNKRLEGVLYEDTDSKDDGFLVKAGKKGDITIRLDDRTIYYKIPVDLWIKKGLRITSVEAKGLLELEFKTDIHISPDWNLETVTEVEGFKWQEKPVLKLGFADLPIEFIANTVLRRSKSKISTAIDKEVSANFSLRKFLEEAWNEMHEPQLVSESFRSWVLLNPQHLTLSPFRSNDELIESHVQVLASPSIVLGEKPKDLKFKPLPQFTFGEFGSGEFSVGIMTMIPFEEAEKIANENLVGQTFSQGRRTVKVEKIKLYGQGNRLVVGTELSGSFKGHVYFLGEPKYNPSNNAVEFSDFDFDINSKNFLLKSAGWLFKGTLKNKIRENINFYLEYNLEEIKKNIQKEMDGYEFSQTVKMRGHLRDIGLREAVITPEGIRVSANLKGSLDLEIRGF